MFELVTYMGLPGTGRSPRQLQQPLTLWKEAEINVANVTLARLLGLSVRV